VDAGYKLKANPVDLGPTVSEFGCRGRKLTAVRLRQGAELGREKIVPV
jgi:hypothetical protein